MIVLISPVDLAAWRDNRNIGEPEVCRRVLQEGGFDADQLLQDTEKEHVKKLLFANTSRYIHDKTTISIQLMCSCLRHIVHE